MYCRFCGTKIPDNVKFCPECGANLAPVPSAAPEESAPAVPAAPEIPTPYDPPPYDPAPYSADPFASADVAAAPQRGMKWFKFIIYFQLWASMLVYLVTAGKHFTGAYYEGNADWVYSVYPTLKALDVCMGIFSAALCVYTVFVQRSLAKFRTKGPMMYYSLYAIDVGIALLYILIGSIIVGFSLFSADIAAGLAPSVIMILINIRYFNNRKHLFVNP